MPTLIYKSETCYIVLDPNDQFPDAGSNALFAGGGFLTQWVKDYFENLNETDENKISFQTHMQHSYGFGKLYPMKMTMHSDNHLSYPDDPDMHPLIHIKYPLPTKQPLQAFIYQYAIIALIQDDETFITRMN